MSEALVTLPDGRKAKITFDSPEQLDATIADLSKGATGAGVDTKPDKPSDAPADKPASWGPSASWDKMSPFEKWKSRTPYAGDIVDALQSEARGVIDPLVGIGQAVGHVIGQGDKVDPLVQKREADIAADRAAQGKSGTDGFRLAGNVMAPTNYIVPGGSGANALTRVASSMGAGAVAGATMPVTQGNFAMEKAQQAGVGAVAGGVLSGAVEAVSAGFGAIKNAATTAMKRWVGEEMPSSLKSAAVHKVLEQFGQDEKAGGPSATEVMDLLNKARAADKPMTLADMGGENVKALAGYVTRQPGEAMTTSRNLMASRDKTAAQRIAGDISQHVTSGPSMKQTADALTQTRAAAAKPLYEEAMKPGSTAPLEQSFNSEFGRIQTERAAAEKELAAAERQSTASAAKRAQSGIGGDIRGSDQAKADGTAIDAAHAKIAKLDADEAKTIGVLRESQRAAAAGERGGVWSPRIQQFLEDPIIKVGIRKGLEVQRLESLAEGKAFNASDYAIQGVGKDGEPIVAKVPNMRLLDASKRGLDEILEGYRDKTSGRLVLDQRGRAIDQVRRSLVDELDRLNPSYKAARASWSGPSQSIDAMKMGSDIFNRSPEQVAENFGRLSANDKEFFRLGVADKLREKIAKTGVGGDEAKAIIKNQWTQSQLRPIFETQEQFDKFIDAATMESKMFDTAFRLKGGSHTAERLASDHAFDADVEAAGHGISAAKNALTGGMLHAAKDMWKMKQALGWRKNQALNAEIAKLLFDPALTQSSLQSGAGQRLLQNFPGPVTQNYLAQGIRNALSRAAPAASVIANQGVSQ